MAELKSRADRLKLTIDSSHDRSIFVARDSFNNSNHISRDETDAHIDNIQGTVSLRRISSYNHNDSNARIIIGDSSNGFIGNLHQVRQTTPSAFCGRKISRTEALFFMERATHVRISMLSRTRTRPHGLNTKLSIYLINIRKTLAKITVLLI